MTTYLDTLLGQTGRASFTVTTASYTQPAVNSSVTVAVLDSSWVPVGLALFVGVGGNYQVTAVPDGTHITIKNLGGSSNAAPAATVSTSQRVASAGAAGATGPAGPTGTPAITPVDILVTSNVAVLSGAAQTFDGIAATAGKRLLLTGQTTPSQNGIWTAAVGAWVYGFAVDADVVAAVGVAVFVRPGGLTIPAEGQNWQLTTGTTVVGAKTYAKVAAGKSIADIDLVQTAAFPGTFSAGVWTATAMGVLSPTIFDGSTPTTGQRVEFNSLGAAAAGNGVFVPGVVGSGGAAATFVRATDLDDATDFVGGVSYNVLGGTLKGTRRYLKTTGAVVVNTTPLSFGPVREKDLKEIDASKEPYNVLGAPNAGAATIDYAGPLKRALRDLRLAGGGTLRLPMGWISCSETLHIPSNVRVTGAGRSKTFLQQIGRVGGWQVFIGDNAPYTIASPFVDATSLGSSAAAPIKMWDPAGSVYDPIINLTDCGWYYTKFGTSGWAAYDTRIAWRPAELGVGKGGHIFSTRGRVARGLPLDACDEYVLNDDGSVSAWIRAWHPSKVKKLAGSGATVLTLSGTPLPEGVMLRVEILTAGARGTFRFRVSECNGGSWGWSGAVDPTTGKAAGILSAATNTLDGHLAGVVLNWSNASAATDDVWQNWERISVFTAAGKMSSTSTTYQIALTFDGTTANLRVSAVGGAYDSPTGSQTANTTLTGALIQQQVYEDSYLGSGCNALLQGAYIDRNSAHGHFGAILSQNTIGSFAGNVPAAVISALNAADIWYLFQPNTAQQLYEDPANPASAVQGYMVSGTSPAEVINGRNVQGTLSFAQNCSVDELTIISTQGRGCGLLVDGGVIQTRLEQIECAGHAKGLVWNGTGYYTRIADIIAGGSRIAMALISCETPLRGSIILQGSGILYFENNGGSDSFGNIWTNTSGRPYAGIIVGQPQGNRNIYASLAGEGSDGGYKLAAAVLSVGKDKVLQLDGVCASYSRQSIYIDNVVGGDIANGQVIINCQVSFVDPGATCLVTTHGSPVCPPVKAGPNFSSPGGFPFTDRADFWIPFGGKPASTALDAAAITSATVLTATGTINGYTIAAAQVAASDALRLAGLAEGNEFRIAVRIQAFDLLIKDDASGATIDTITAGMYGTFVYRSNGVTYKVTA